MLYRLMRGFKTSSLRVNGARFFSVEVNGTLYAPPLVNRPVVGICLDGSAQEYIDRATEANCMPNWNKVFKREKQQGQWGLVAGVMPSYTNPNNVAIICGTTPDRTGISGNYFYDEASDREVMMNDPSYITCRSILGQLSQSKADSKPVKVLAVTAKDKLRRLLSHELNDQHGFAFSVEKAEQESSRLLEHGIDWKAMMGGDPIPTIYQPEISVTCLEVGLKHIQWQKKKGNNHPWLYYLSTTDYVQHKFKPGSKEANSFYQKIDNVLGRLDQEGAIIGLTADHGMLDKVGYNGKPKVIYLESVLKENNYVGRVILPITDPYVVHHAALGSFAYIYLSKKDDILKVMELLRTIPGICTVMNRKEACKTFELPASRIGDIVVVAQGHVAVGRTPEHHDLSQVSTGLRSHGGLEEQTVPMWINAPLKKEYARRLTSGKGRNFHLFDFLLNGVDLAPKANGVDGARDGSDLFYRLRTKFPNES